MPSYLQNQPRDQLRFVQVRKNSNLFYGWNTKNFTTLEGVSGADSFALGHREPTEMESRSGAVCIIGANTPKPARATKVINRKPTLDQQGNASTFCAGTHFSSAQQAGWKIGAGVKTPHLRVDTRVSTVAVRVEGGGYYLVYKKSTSFVNQYAEELGLMLPGTISRAELMMCFSGSRKPRPPKVRKDGVGQSFCSYDSVQTAMQSGWTVIDDGTQYDMGLPPV